MITRFVQFGVIALWLTMTVWLVRTTWFPDESRFESVELREVMNAMFENWNERAELVLLENGSEVGRMSVSASHARDDDDSGEERRHRLSTEGALSEFGVLEFTERGSDESENLSEINARRDKLIWRAVIGMDDQSYEFASVEVVLRFPEQAAKLELNYVKATDDVAVKALLNGIPVVQFEGKLSELRSALPGPGPGAAIGFGMGFPLAFPSPDQAAGATGGNEMLSTISQWLPALLSGGTDKGSGGRLEELMPRLTATFGRTKIAGEPMAVYLLLVTVGPENEGKGKSDDAEKAIRIYIGEDGRPVLIDTPFGFEAIAEVMVPDSASKTEAAAEPKVITRLP